MEANREMTEPSSPPSAACATAVSAVFGNDDLLREILLRLGFPNTLVCAALVSKRWLRQASDPAFLRRFRERHPPALLGFYLSETASSWPLQFVTVSQSPELSAVIRRARSIMHRRNIRYCRIMDCRNGRLLVNENGGEADCRIIGCRNGRLLVNGNVPREAVLSPLQPTCAKAILPPPPKQQRWGSLYKTFLSDRDSADMETDNDSDSEREEQRSDDSTCAFEREDEGSDDSTGASEREEQGSYAGTIAVLMLPEPIGTETKIQVDLLTPRSRVKRSGVWVVHRSEVILLLEKSPPITYTLPPVRGKIYSLTSSGQVLRLDLTACTGSLLQLPDRVLPYSVVKDNLILRLTDRVVTDNFMISSGEDEEDGSMLSLIYADGHQLSIWQLPTTSSDAGDWLLVYDKIHVREACSRLEKDVRVMAVDDSLEFVFLWLQSCAVLMHMHLPSRSEKVYNELNVCDGYNLEVHPFMMVWPPIFPALREEDNLEE